MKTKLLSILIVCLIILVAMVGCSTAPVSTPTPTPTPTLKNEQPIEVVSAMEPVEMANPGGPPIEITLKNVSDEPVVSLSAILPHIQKENSYVNFSFIFNISAANPLLPDKTISSRLHLIDSGTSENTSYPLVLSGSLQSGATFAYTKLVQFKPQPVTDQQPIEFVSASGPIPPFTPGNPPYTHEGWSAEITLKNVSDEPVINLWVILGTNAPGITYTSDLDFDITSSNPLLPGKTISAKGTMFSATGNITYSLGIIGTWQSGAAFFYEKQVQITAPKN